MKVIKVCFVFPGAAERNSLSILQMIKTSGRPAEPLLHDGRFCLISQQLISLNEPRCLSFCVSAVKSTHGQILTRSDDETHPSGNTSISLFYCILLLFSLWSESLLQNDSVFKKLTILSANIQKWLLRSKPNPNVLQFHASSKYI